VLWPFHFLHSVCISIVYRLYPRMQCQTYNILPTIQMIFFFFIFQGILGDCYYLGALSVVSTHQTMLFDLFPDIDADLVVQNNSVAGTPTGEQQANAEGLYAVRFWREGQWRIVIVDDLIPCNSSGRPCFAQLPEHGCEIWVLIAEKAFAKLNGSYESIVAGQENEALADITGGLPQDYKLRGIDADSDLSETVLWNKLIAHSDANEINLVCASTFQDGNEKAKNEDDQIGSGTPSIGKGMECNRNNCGIMSGHAYGIVDLKEIRFNEQVLKMIKIRNPWGKGEEWNGAFCDSDVNRWNQIDQTIQTEMGFCNDDDGAWWMTFYDFYKHYDVVNVCRILRQPHWTGHHATGEWFGDLLPGGQTSYRNSQYQLMVHEDSTVFINVGRPSSRARNEKYMFGIGPLVEYCSGPAPARCGKRMYDVGLTKHRQAAKLEVDRECCVEIQVKKSDRPYLIVCAFVFGLYCCCYYNYRYCFPHNVVWGVCVIVFDRV
jgi:hypothetical protein